MTAFEVGAIAVAGFASGVVNTLAGGGSLLTVPLLVMIGLPGTVANGTNRVGVFVQSVVGALRFRAEGVSGFSKSLPVLLPLLAGGTLGALAVAHLDDATLRETVRDRDAAAARPGPVAAAHDAASKARSPA